MSDYDEGEGFQEEDLDEGQKSVDDQGLGSLISFANLESVLRHIIRRFKAMDARHDGFDTLILQIQKNLEGRATLGAVEEVGQELATRAENINKAISGCKESILGLEAQLQESRLFASALDKRLEAAVQEKALQDRVIREIQDVLQDKVAVSDLAMFEAKFAGYTTKLEHQEAVDSLRHYARTEDTERIIESVKLLGTRFDDYTRTARANQQLQELRDWVTDELTLYAKARQTMDKLDDLQAMIRDQSLSFERVHSAGDEKLRSLSDRVTSLYTELSSELQMRALASDLKETRDGLRKYALRIETDAFHQDCVPKLKFCVDSIKAFDERLRSQDDAIQRVDEILLDKAGKYDIVVLNSRLEQCYQKDLAAKEFQKMIEQINWMGKRLEQYIDGEAERLEQVRPPDYSAIFEDLGSQIMLKADKADVVEMYQLKANRIDADELAKLQDTVHRQLEYLAVTTFGLSKLALTEAKTGESKTIRAQQKAQVLMQSEALWHWILHNEPPPNLDTLRPPPGRQRLMVTSEAEDEVKRALDEQKRRRLEQKFGLRMV